MADPVLNKFPEDAGSISALGKPLVDALVLPSDMSLTGCNTPKPKKGQAKGSDWELA